MRQTDGHHLKEVEKYFLNIPIDVRSSLSEDQSSSVKKALSKALEKAKPSPKIVDLRFVIDLIIARYYFVLFVGRDRRSKKRTVKPNVINRIGNITAVVLLLIGLNLLVSSIILLGLYLTKSAIGIDFFPGHMGKPPTEYIYIDPNATN